MAELHETSAPSAPAVNEAVLDSRPGRLARWLARPRFWIAAVLLLVVVPLAAALARTRPEPPAVLLELPTFQFTSEQGVPFGSDDLRGKVWVASFAFTTCPVVCPQLMEKLAVIQHRTRNAGPAVHLVTISVDPETDTPERLAEYARRFKANPSRWTFLTGELSSIEETVVKGFKLAMGRGDADNLFEIFHAERFVLVDRNGRIRGYYDADDAGIDHLVRDIGLVLDAS